MSFGYFNKFWSWCPSMGFNKIKYTAANETEWIKAIILIESKLSRLKRKEIKADWLIIDLFLELGIEIIYKE